MSHRDQRPSSVDPLGFDTLLQQFLEWMRVQNYSDKTVTNRRVFLTAFLLWAIERGLTRPVDVTKHVLECYQRHLFHYRKANGEPLTFPSQHARLLALRAWFKWLSRHNHIGHNPAADLELPKVGQQLPKHVLTATEADAVINLPDVSTTLGLRDRAILETFYSTGVRRQEAIDLCVYDVDVSRGTLTVRQGKGKKDRIIPIGDRALAWIGKYVHDVRPTLRLLGTATDVLFLTHVGGPFTPNRMSQLVSDYIDAADIGKRGSCHLFRHTMATLMLENGADIRFIQQMLGHARLDTTQIYTQVSIRKLKDIHSATHPAKLRRDAGENAE